MATITPSTEVAVRRPIGFGDVAPWLFVFLWSTGFVGARLGLPYIEPFTFLLIRFALATGLLALIALVMRAPWPRNPAAIGHSIVVGLLLHGGYLGGVFFAIDRGMSAGLSALIVSLQPILAAALVGPLFGERVGVAQWLGLGLGFAGVALVIGEKLALGSLGLSTAALIAVVVALICTTAATLYQKRFATGTALTSGTAIQYAAALGLMAVLAPTTETMAITWHPELIIALLWLLGALSVGAILLLMLLLRQHSAARVSSLFYLVPPATALEAYLLFGEQFGWQAFLGLICASIGVALATRQPKR